MESLLSNFDSAAMASRYQNAMPVPHICLDNFLSPAFAREVELGFPSFAEAKELGVGFKAINEKGKIQITDAAKFQPAVKKLHHLLASPEFLSSLEELTGIPNLLADPEMVGGGIHETGPRGHLDVHVDFNYIEKRQLHRRLNVLIYFNDSWDESWGGNFELWDESVENCMASFSPIFNRMCMFNTNEISYHGVTAVKCPSTRSRKSFAAYYYTREAPEGWDGSSHTTIFKPRPAEKFKGGVLMPAQSIVAKSKAAVKRIIGRK
ncbi:2OG-Fe(II) oxygenase [Phycisphaerales bacterium]|nr:2OG-Fe(II) oxygenase [Phycisphaerales bacterium]